MTGIYSVHIVQHREQTNAQLPATWHCAGVPWRVRADSNTTSGMAESVLKALRGIERHYGPKGFPQIFKSITTDNGSEFLDFEALEASSLTARSRTRLFYAHA